VDVVKRQVSNLTYHRVCKTTVQHVEQELLTFSEHLSSHPVLNGVRVAR
jgi:hypothetical protein